MFRKALGWAGVIFTLASCSSLAYKNDVGFLVSAQANSAEYPVYVNGKLCTDLEGNPGLCSKRIKSTESLTFSFDPQSFAYSLTMNCTNGVTGADNATVPAGQTYAFTLKPDDFSPFRSFTCIGEVAPEDRTAPISAKFRVTIEVVDAGYVARERAYITTQSGKNYLVLGQYARNSWVFDEGKWKSHTKDTTVQIKGKTADVKAYSSSYAYRFNYLNMGVNDSGVH